MLTKILKITGAILAVIVISSLVNPFLAYHERNFVSVQFGRYYEYSGVVNIHTTYSDGSGSFEQIERTCDSLGIHFAIFSDLNTVKPLTAGYDHHYGMTLIIPGTEVSNPTGSERYVIIGDSIPLIPSEKVGLDSVLVDAARKGSIVILSHVPESTMDSIASANGPANFSGIELYDFNQSLKESVDFFQINKLIGASMAYSVDPRCLNYMLMEPKRNEKFLDRLNEAGHFFGIGALGARSNINLGGKSFSHFPSYEDMLNLVHTVIVTRTPYNALYRHDRELTLNAIRNGNMYVAFSGIEPGRGFLFTATSGDSEVLMGDSLRLSSRSTLNISLPDSSSVETVVLRNGTETARFSNVGRMSVSVAKPGVYRVVVYQKRAMLPLFIKRYFPWIISNPIRIYR